MTLMTTKPLLNYALIEVQQDDAAVSRADETEILSKGIVRDVSVLGFHLTASAALEFSPGGEIELKEYASELVGKLVRWEQYAEGGQTFGEDGKTYALIPWWRLISVSEVEETE